LAALAAASASDPPQAQEVAPSALQEQKVGEPERLMTWGRSKLIDNHREVHRCGDKATLRQFAAQCVTRIATIETFQRAPSAETHAWGSIR
jgi:hypothetical protein